MSEIFLKLLNMSIAASYLILAVLLLRLLLKKAPRWICVLLWGIVAFRLICPVSIESIFSLIPSAETVSPEIMTDPKPEIHTGITFVNNAVNPVISQSFAPQPAASANPLQIWTAVASVVWLAGMAVMLCYMAVSYFLVHRKVRTAVKYKDNIFQCENVDSPFVLGLFRPKIYLPFAIGEEDLSYVVAHEQAHIHRKDHWWKPFGFLLLTVYWFNPLMWLGYILLCRDIEFACDEKVIAGMDNGAKADYSQALVACSVHRRRIAACPLAFGEVGVKERVKSVMNYRKPAFWIILIALISCIILAVCFLTNPKTEDPNDSETEAKTHATAPTVTLQNPGVPGLSLENGKYFLTLPQSGETLELSDTEVWFVPYITDTLVAEAERKILEQTAEYGENSGFYLQITDDYLCLAMEIIKDLTPPEPTGTEAGNILSGCGIDHEHIFYSERISTQPVKEETELRLLQYTWDGWGIATKTVGDCDAANRIRDALDAMQETGETAPKISDGTLEAGGGQYPTDPGTVWIEWEDRIWRLTPEPAQLCLVQTHLGEGRILEMPEGFLKDVNDAWRYAPYDYYRGTYRSGEKTVNLENVYQAYTTVAMCVKDIHVESSHDPHNTITLELTSTVDQIVSVKLRCQQSDDNLTWGDDEILELKKDVPQTVELEFGGWKDARYWIYMEAANTKAEIIIEP